jgi:hypothetical protein
MNSHQRRKYKRKLGRSKDKDASDHLLIENWADLAKVPDSDTHRLEIDVEWCNGWIYEKNPLTKNTPPQYLSTHTFYGSNYLRSTRILRKCGFNVSLANWDSDNYKNEY